MQTILVSAYGVTSVKIITTLLKNRVYKNVGWTCANQYASSAWQQHNDCETGPGIDGTCTYNMQPFHQFCVSQTGVGVEPGIKILQH